jgi:hypothetical protein
VLPDGSVARVVGEDYHVEWWGTDRRTVSGSPVPHRRIRVGGAEREAWVRDLLSAPAAGMSSTAGGTPGSAPTRQEVAARLGTFDPARFPDRVPPVRWGYTPASPRGHVWVKLETESGLDRTVFDVIDRGGAPAHRLFVEGRARVVGFGPDAVYVVRVDDFDLEWLERYPYPRG